MTYHTYRTIAAHRPLPPLANVVFTLAVSVLKWEERRQTRRSLKQLDAHMLRDIGISQAEAHAEATKPFWAK
jgi:uncharacterized protein YjiS (DUF1127 family)